MTPKKNRLFGLMLFFIPLSLGVFFLMSALKSNIVYFFSPSELVNSNNINQKLRLGGLVEEDSIIINGKLVKFRITDGNKSVLVQYNGILPDLFKGFIFGNFVSQNRNTCAGILISLETSEIVLNAWGDFIIN